MESASAVNDRHVESGMTEARLRGGTAGGAAGPGRLAFLGA